MKEVIPVNESEITTFCEVMNSLGTTADALASRLEQYAAIWCAALNPEEEIALIRQNPGLNFIQKARLIKQIKQISK